MYPQEILDKGCAPATEEGRCHPRIQAWGGTSFLTPKCGTGLASSGGARPSSQYPLGLSPSRGIGTTQSPSLDSAVANIQCLRET